MAWYFNAFRVATVGLLLVAQTAVAKRWVLPVADGGDATPSPPSVQGRLVSVNADTLALQPESRRHGAAAPATVAITADTEMFGAYGGAVDREELLTGQYVWIWYIRKHAKRAGSPPRAAVVMLWSTSPDDQPLDDIRWHHDRGE